MDTATRVDIPTNQIELISDAQDPVLLSTANDLISNEEIVPQEIGALSEVAEPIRFGPIT